MSANITFGQSSTVPEGFCHTTWQETFNLFRSLLTGTLSGNTQFINYGPNTPAAADRDKPWYKTNADFTPVRLYSFSNGSWLALHPLPPGMVMMYEGSEPSITTLDGGESAAVTLYTGPMWEKVTSMDARFPVGPGTFTGGTVVPVGGTGGADTVTLTSAQIPAHSHSVTIGAADQNGTGYIETGVNPQNPTTVNTGVAGGGAGGGTDAHPNLPPYIGIFFLRRTARLYYRA